MLSTVIITYNEEANIERCIRSVQSFCIDVVVIDSFSTDRTKEICLDLGVLFMQKEWKGYSNAKNKGNEAAVGDWILSLDADEEITSELAKEIIKASKQKDFDAYYIPRLTQYCGKWIKHGGWYPEKHIRLFRKSKAEWNSDEVHEDLIVSGKTGSLKKNMLHYSMNTVEEHLEKVEKYSTLAAQKMKRKGKKPGFVKLKLAPPFKFFRDYILRLGFLDGVEGFRIAKICSHEVYLKYAKLKELYGQDG